MERPSLKDRLRYLFDRTMSRGPTALISWLALLTILAIISASLIGRIVGRNTESTLGEKIEKQGL